MQSELFADLLSGCFRCSMASCSFFRCSGRWMPSADSSSDSLSSVSTCRGRHSKQGWVISHFQQISDCSLCSWPYGSFPFIGLAGSDSSPVTFQLFCCYCWRWLITGVSPVAIRTTSFLFLIKSFDLTQLGIEPTKWHSGSGRYMARSSRPMPCLVNYLKLHDPMISKYFKTKAIT